MGYRRERFIYTMGSMYDTFINSLFCRVLFVALTIASGVVYGLGVAIHVGGFLMAMVIGWNQRHDWGPLSG